MPELDNFNKEKVYSSRFIRIGGKIYFSDSTEQLHKDLVSSYAKGEKVDDAGWLQNRDGKLVAIKESRSLNILEDNQNRVKTNHILSELQ